MPYEIGYGMGRGVGRGRGRGHGSGFRGFSPPWPYVGRGRGGLPRCGYYADYPSYIAPNSPGEVPVAANYDLGGLKNSVNALKDRLAQMQAMISEMEQQKA
jgi:hypothetical protein